MQHASRKQIKTHHEKRNIREYFNFKRNGIFVEIGAHEPTSIESQSWHLENELGWSGILVEPNPYLNELARKSRPKATVFQCACTSPEKVGELSLYIPLRNGNRMTAHASLEKNVDSFSYQRHEEVKVQAKTLDSLLEESAVSAIDLISIDVEGTELDVLKGFDLQKHRPSLILLEDKLVYLEKHRYLINNGYRLVKRTKQNNWYIPEGNQRPAQTWGEKLRLMKKLYLSIWYKKLRFSLKSKSMDPLRRL